MGQIKRAGGFQVCDGGPGFKRVQRRDIQRWRIIIKRLVQDLQQSDPRVGQMLTDAATEWETYSRPAYSQWTSLTPLQKQQTLFRWILDQPAKRMHQPVDILASGIAGFFYHELKPQPRHDDYARAVTVARPVWFLLRAEWKTYERDNGHGHITVERVWINRRVQLRSRNAAQRIEANVKLHADWFMQEYRSRIIDELMKTGLV